MSSTTVPNLILSYPQLEVVGQVGGGGIPDTITGPSGVAGNDITIAADGKHYFDHEKAYFHNVPVFADKAARNLAIPSPAIGQVCAIVDGMCQYVGGGLWVPIPQGVLAYTEVNANQTGVLANTQTVLTGLTLSFVSRVNHVYRISQKVSWFAQPGTFITDVADASSGNQQLVIGQTSGVVAGNGYDCRADRIMQMTPMTHNLICRCQCPGSAPTIIASAGNPNWVMVEDMGLSMATIN